MLPPRLATQLWLKPSLLSRESISACISENDVSRALREKMSDPSEPILDSIFAGEDERFLYGFDHNFLFYILDMYLNVQTSIVMHPWILGYPPKGWVDKNNRLHLMRIMNYISPNRSSRSYLKLRISTFQIDVKCRSLKMLDKRELAFDYDDTVYFSEFESSSSRFLIFSTKHKQMQVYAVDDLETPLAVFNQMPKYFYGAKPKMLASIDGDFLFYSNISLCTKPPLVEIMKLCILTGERQTLPIDLKLFDTNVAIENSDFCHLEQFVKNSHLYLTCCSFVSGDNRKYAHFFKIDTYSGAFMRFRIQMPTNTAAWFLAYNPNNTQLKLVSFDRKQSNTANYRQIHVILPSIGVPQSLRILSIAQTKLTCPHVLCSIYSAQFKKRTANWRDYGKGLFCILCCFCHPINYVDH